MAYPVKNVPKHTVLFREGSAGNVAYLLKQGKVELFKNVNGTRKVIAVLTPVTMFGEMALISDRHMRTASAAALNDVKLVEIRAEDFETVIKETPPMVQAMINILVQRLRISTERAVHAPSPFKGTALILELLTRHSVSEVVSDVMEDILGRLFHMDSMQLQGVIAELEQLGMLSQGESELGGMIVRPADVDDFEPTACRRRLAQRSRVDVEE